MDNDLECQACGRRWRLRRWYRECSECGHVWRTRWHLLLDYRFARWWGWRRFGWAEDCPAWRIYLGGHWRPGRIPFCQCCTHDF
jgi:hypothetical protein